MLLTDDPYIAKLVQDDTKTQDGSVDWFFVDRIPKIGSGHFVCSRLHEAGNFICSWAEEATAVRVATFLNQNIHYFRPDEDPEVLAEKLEKALFTGWFTLGLKLH